MLLKLKRHCRRRKYSALHFQLAAFYVLLPLPVFSTPCPTGISDYDPVVVVGERLQPQTERNYFRSVGPTTQQPLHQAIIAFPRPHTSQQIRGFAIEVASNASLEAAFLYQKPSGEVARYPIHLIDHNYWYGKNSVISEIPTSSAVTLTAAEGFDFYLNISPVCDSSSELLIHKDIVLSLDLDWSYRDINTLDNLLDYRGLPIHLWILAASTLIVFTSAIAVRFFSR